LNNVTAIILCGGKGERLKPFTESLPKPLVAVNGIPLLHYSLALLQKEGVKKFIFASGYKSEVLEQHLKENFCELDYIIDNQGDVDILTRLRSALTFVDNQFLLLYGDTVANVNLKLLANSHEKSQLDLSVTLFPFQSTFGLFEFSQNGTTLESFSEKPVLDYWINIGYFFGHKNFGSKLNHQNEFSKLLEDLTRNKRMNGFKHQGFHVTINTERELREAEEVLKQVKSF
jgi:NDP-sugar pyrophosphorylase family protein